MAEQNGVKVVVDRDKCMGHAICAQVAPDLMDLDDLGYNITEDLELPADQAVQAHRAADSCPEGAIRILQVGE
ncbi:ferredoxin [Nocardia sp. CA-135953]|uniref:ferredoxin n=1 Tax=Nocardia sp. CA-135953 TaxID=3239978 RepID=UPI003D96588D